MRTDEKKAGGKFRHVKMVRLRDEDIARLQLLARHWDRTEADAFRQALALAASTVKEQP